MAPSESYRDSLHRRAGSMIQSLSLRSKCLDVTRDWRLHSAAASGSARYATHAQWLYRWCFIFMRRQWMRTLPSQSASITTLRRSCSDVVGSGSERVAAATTVPGTLAKIPLSMSFAASFISTAYGAGGSPGETAHSLRSEVTPIRPGTTPSAYGSAECPMLTVAEWHP